MMFRGDSCSELENNVSCFLTLVYSPIEDEVCFGDWLGEGFGEGVSDM